MINLYNLLLKLQGDQLPFPLLTILHDRFMKEINHEKNCGRRKVSADLSVRAL